MSDLRDRLRRLSGAQESERPGEKRRVISELRQRLKELEHPVSRLEDDEGEGDAVVHGPEGGATLDVGACVPGERIEIDEDQVFVASTAYPLEHGHGTFRLDEAEDLSQADMAQAFGEVRAPGCRRKGILYMDTETTGLAGGTGTYAFMIGVGYFEENGFRIEQFFLEDLDGEEALLRTFERRARKFQCLVTFNGRAYDVPLLNSRFVLSRLPAPFPGMQHIDLLPPSRRLFRRHLDNCRLVTLEDEVLGARRDGDDIPGALIPGVYFDYLKTGDGAALGPIFDHNRDDILSMVSLLNRIVAMHRAPYEFPVHLADIARLREFRDGREAIELYLAAAEYASDEREVYDCLWRASLPLKRSGRFEEACALWRRMLPMADELDPRPYEELAKHLEHRCKEFRQALEVTEQALCRIPPYAVSLLGRLEHRRRRLEARIAREKGY